MPSLASVSHLATHCIQNDPDNQLTLAQHNIFKNIVSRYDKVFATDIPWYNGAAGPFQAVVNMGPVQPPQRNGGCVPQYFTNKLRELQTQFDEPEHMGIFQTSEQVGVCAEYLNPSFLVKKGS